MDKPPCFNCPTFAICKIKYYHKLDACVKVDLLSPSVFAFFKLSKSCPLLQQYILDKLNVSRLDSVYDVIFSTVYGTVRNKQLSSLTQDLSYIFEKDIAHEQRPV